jgi:Fic family protein
MTILYEMPGGWIRYDKAEVVDELAEAKAAVLSLANIPFQRSWAEALQAIELKREVAGTSRIEGADFTERELEEAISGDPARQGLTRSQRQARAAIQTYRWIAHIPPDRPVDEGLIREIHRRIVTGCDDDHCAPGELRGDGHNVTFGRPRHRGAEGGRECAQALRRLCGAANQEFRAHDPLIQALALHYHLGAMHPFQDGNGRTARALEALLLRRAQLKDSLFIAMSNYYYEEKDTYLASLSDVRQRNFDLTPFLKFGLRGIARQCHRLLQEIRTHVAKSLFRDVMAQMYGRLRSTRKRALAKRQLAILEILLEQEKPIPGRKLIELLDRHYQQLRAPTKAFARDLVQLENLRAIAVVDDGLQVAIRLDWPTEITETQFYAEINKLPPAKTRLLR